MNIKRGSWLKELLRAYSASAGITLGALNASPRPFEFGQEPALERTHDAMLINGFDPREIVARRVIITLPLDDGHEASERSGFNPN